MAIQYWWQASSFLCLLCTLSLLQQNVRYLEVCCNVLSTIKSWIFSNYGGCTHRQNFQDRAWAAIHLQADTIIAHQYSDKSITTLAGQSLHACMALASATFCVRVAWLNLKYISRPFLSVDGVGTLGSTSAYQILCSLTLSIHSCRHLHLDPNKQFAHIHLICSIAHILKMCWGGTACLQFAGFCRR